MFNELPLYGIYDVIIVGGGTSGFAAGIAAAKEGVKTLIIEEKAHLGGTSTGGMISQFMGFVNGETTKDQKGIFGDLLKRLIDMKASNGIETIYLSGLKDMDVGASPYDSEALKYAMDEMVKESGAKILFHTKAVGVYKEDDEIKHLIIHNNQGLQRVQAKVFIDSSFHGSIAADAGCKWEIGDHEGNIQPGTLMYKMVDVDRKAYANLSQEKRREIAKQGIDEGKMFVDNLLARALPNGVIYSNMSRVTVNPLDADGLSSSEIKAREQVNDISQFFIENVPGFENAKLVSTGHFLGLRDSRRILGKYILTKDDIIDGTDFHDSIAASSYPIDIHDANGFSSTLIKPKTGAFHIPYRCMINEVKNLIVAGRCISADYEAHACIRVMVTCIRVGQAAGLAAAESVKSEIYANEMDGTIIGGKLRKLGLPV
jgi:hypothetical protein